ncbi:hypothetical protein BDW75DRAFT_245961 [Aspergillus navahoensis]
MLAGVAWVLLTGLRVLSPVLAADVFCSATKPCEIGCCDKYGICGMGPDFCGADVCINSCDAKAECNPDNWPSEYVNATTCPLNVCCSPYGFCGTTEEFCGNKTVNEPSCDASSQSLMRVIGYYNSAAASRSCNAMAPYSIPQGVYSHLYFAFGSIDPDTFKVIPAMNGDEALYTQLAALQVRDLDQELWISIGGWDFSDSDQPTATTFSDLVGASSVKQGVFFKSLISFMGTYGFTGVDIDWEYPVADDRNGRTADYKNYPTFLFNLKKALDDYKYGLSITLPTSYWYLQHFDLKAMEPSVDWFNFMSYDLHGTWDMGNEWTGAYLDAQTNLTEIKSALDLLWRVDIKPSKVNLGLAFYGRTFTLASSSCSDPGCLYLSAGTAGQCSNSAGILFNSEIESIISENNLTSTLYKDAAVKTITWDTDQWVSYDDEETWKLKAEYAKSICLGGVLVWSVDEDDSNQTFSKGLAAALGNKINLNTTTGMPLEFYERSNSTTTTTSSQDSVCRFINCGQTCPSGFTEIARDNKENELMLDSTECLVGGHQTQTLCCPSSSELPTCQWRGFHNSGKCKGGCEDGEAEVGTITKGCHSGYQSACCTITTSTQPWSECAWTSDCEEDDTCPSGYDTFVGSVPKAFTNCAWTGHEITFTNTQFCTDACPTGAIRIAEEDISVMWGADHYAKTSNCMYGNEAYCCNGTTTTTTTTVGPRSSTETFADDTAYEFHYYLDKWFQDPTCGPNEDAGFSYSASFDKRGLNERDSSSSTISKHDLVYLYTLSYLVAWITSPKPRTDLTDIFNGLMTHYGYEEQAANLTTLTDTLYVFGDWTGTPVYDAQPLVANYLCDIANSRGGVESLGTASSVLCELFEDDDDNLSRKRTLTELIEDEQLEYFNGISDNARSENGDQPSILTALQGVVNGDLTFHYARWIRGDAREDVILELAFWNGPEPGTAPTEEMLARYGDSGDTANTDLWIVFHLHIPLDLNTFRRVTESDPNYYPGLSAMGVYHSQTLHSLGDNEDPRAEYRYSQTYTGVNSGAMQNYNDRSQSLQCRNDARWYIGRDSVDSIQQAQRRNLPTAYAQALNQFGIWIFDQGLFAPANLGYIWPAIAHYTGGFLPANGIFNGGTNYNPQTGAFTTNWNFQGAQVVINGATSNWS